MRTPRSPRSTVTQRTERLLACLVGALTLVLVGCSADRPELVQPTAEDGTIAPTTIPLPERESCRTGTGPGPIMLTLASAEGSADQPLPCVVVAAHHRLEVANPDAVAADLAVGSTSLSVPAGGSQVTEPVGEVLVAGPNRLVAGTETAAVVFLVEAEADPLRDQAIGLSSIGDIELGLEPAEVTAAAGGIPVAAAGTPCHVATLAGDPYSPLFTFRNGRLVVVQVFTPGLVTRSGIGLGATSADIAAAYGSQIEVRPDPDGDPASQLQVFVPSDEENQIYRLVFDLTDDRVTTMRFGATEIVADQPGCGP